MNDPQKSEQPLNIAVLSSASGGGAGIAARRVTDALNSSPSMTADFLDMVALGGRMPDDAAPPGNMSNRRITDTHFTVEFPGFMRGWLIDMLQRYDLLNIHWASFLVGLAEIDELSRRGMPILFSCHDYYYFSGGCHYPASCDMLGKGCTGCPQVNTRFCPPLTIAGNQRIKKSILARPNVFLSAPSQFLVNEAIDAGLVQQNKTFVLRNPYLPIQNPIAGEQKGPRRIVLLADSMTERRKAMPLALEALKLAYQALQDDGELTPPFIVEIIGYVDAAYAAAVEQSGFSHTLRGRITDHAEIASILNTCDFLLTCSLEDNWPNVLVEAGAYGVAPIVGPGHGCEEFVKMFGTGEIAMEYSAESFCDAIKSALAMYAHSDRQAFREHVISVHAPSKVSQEYADAFRSVMNTAN